MIFFSACIRCALNCPQHVIIAFPSVDLFLCWITLLNARIMQFIDGCLIYFISISPSVVFYQFDVLKHLNSASGELFEPASELSLLSESKKTPKIDSRAKLSSNSHGPVCLFLAYFLSQTRETSCVLDCMKRVSRGQIFVPRWSRG
jgi:hypothetical protein